MELKASHMMEVEDGCMSFMLVEEVVEKSPGPSSLMGRAHGSKFIAWN